MARPTFLYASTITRVDALAAGALVAAIAREPGGFAKIRRWAVPLGAVALAGLAGLAVRQQELAKLDPIVETFGFSLFAALFAAVVMFVVTRSSAHPALRALASRPLRAVGRVSYAAYIVHYPIMRALEAWLPEAMGPRAKLAVGLVVPAVATAIFAALSWRFLERPLLALKDRVSAPASVRVRQRDSAPSSSPVVPSSSS
jgi:peptidoglycan/LPS O-acetylase OafA/YrhL